MADFSFPARPPETPGFPGNASPINFDTFTGLNTKPSRPAIESDQCYILDGWMPFGKSNARTLYGVGSPIYTRPNSSVTITYYQFYNIADRAYTAVFLSDGSVQQVAAFNLAVTQIAPAGTILSPSQAVGSAQWGSQYFLFCAPQTNGYWVWDGTVLYAAGSTGPAAILANSGLDYVDAPAITPVGGSGTGFAATATVENGSVNKITVTNPGTGYGANDVVILAFAATGTNPNSTATASVTVTAGVITAVTPVDVGLGYTASATVQVLGGGGVGAVITGSIVGTSITSYTIVNGGEGYSSAPTIYVTDANNTIAAAQMDMMPFGISGTTIETYQSIVWVGNGAAPTSPPPKSRVLFSAPGSVSNFGAPSGGGAFVSTDSFLRVGYHSLKQTNGFLYLIGDSSVNTISGVNTTASGGLATTTYINQNQDPQIGSPWQNSVQVFSRNIVFANPFGVHVSYGGAVAKVSDALDGIYTTVPSVAAGTAAPSSAVAVIFGIHVYILLLPIIDQVTGQQVNKMLMWDGKSWWTASQEVPLLFIAGQEINSVMTAYGTDGISIYPLFQTPSVAIQKTIQSKLWDSPGYWFTKTVNRLFGLVDYYDPRSPELRVYIDNTLNSPDEILVEPFQNTINWTNNTGGAISWTNGAAVLSWGQYNGIVVFPPLGASQNGPLIGLTLQTNCADIALLSLGMLSEHYSANI